MEMSMAYQRTPSVMDAVAAADNRQRPSNKFFEMDLGELSGLRHQQLLLSILELTSRKRIGYGRKTDPFAGYNAASEWSVDPWISCMLRASEKLQRLKAYTERGNLKDALADGESIFDAFDDIANLMLIARTLLEKQLGVLPNVTAKTYERLGMQDLISEIAQKAYRTDEVVIGRGDSDVK